MKVRIQAVENATFKNDDVPQWRRLVEKRRLDGAARLSRHGFPLKVRKYWSGDKRVVSAVNEAFSPVGFHA